jgi:hypothetical protein
MIQAGLSGTGHGKIALVTAGHLVTSSWFIQNYHLSAKGASSFEVYEVLRKEKNPPLIALHDCAATCCAPRPRFSKQRIPFSQWGIYRYFKELDQ